MGVDLIVYALEQLGVKVTPTVAWVVLISGGLLVLAAGVGGAIGIYKALRGHKQTATTIVNHFYYGSTPMREERRLSAEEQNKQQPSINVTSHNQQGGITAYQVNIQKGDRQLTENAATQLKKYLANKTFSKIDVVAVMGDGEAFRLASQVKNFLVSQGYSVEGVGQAVFSAPVQGQIIEPPNSQGVIKIIIGNQ